MRLDEGYMLSIDNITVRIAGREIIAGATANLPPGRRIEIGRAHV